MSLLVGKAMNLVRIKNESAPALAAAQVHDSLSSFIESLVAPPASHAAHDYSIYITSTASAPENLPRCDGRSQPREQTRDWRISELTDGKLTNINIVIEAKAISIAFVALVVGEGQLLFVTKTPSVQ